jgi:membrane associated rhomboid family serine protease
MSFQDRQYYQQESGGSGFGGPTGGMRFGMPRPSVAVKWLLIINIVVFVLQSLGGGRVEMLFAAGATPASHIWQVWRLITFQFLHGDPFHLLFNMLGLYFLGPVLERSWGTKKFLTFYLISGTVGGLLYVAADALNILGGGTLIGASGGVLALLVACAILYPQFQVILFVFPVPIRFAAILFTGMYLLNVISKGFNAGGDLCHLGGMATGLVWVMGKGWLGRLKEKLSQRSSVHNVETQQSLQYEVDRILAKVHNHGIHSLSDKEKQILQEATNQKNK